MIKWKKKIIFYNFKYVKDDNNFFRKLRLMFNYLIFVNTIIFDFLFGSSGRSFFLGVFLVFLGFLIFGLFFNFGDSGRFGSLEGLVFFFIFGRLFCSGILFCSGRFG